VIVVSDLADMAKELAIGDLAARARDWAKDIGCAERAW
jgi:hypothetical protein